jgi:hypothetical protein
MSTRAHYLASGMNRLIMNHTEAIGRLGNIMEHFTYDSNRLTEQYKYGSYRGRILTSSDHPGFTAIV